MATKHSSPKAKHSVHQEHAHQHGPNCGHTAVRHDGHTDYLHDSHMHHVDGGTVHEHSIAVSVTNKADCTPDHDCHGHAKDHRHGPTCGHPAVPHGDHTDYLVSGHLHHQHGGHCDSHGEITMA